jgi:O-antigen/teichoic acid export membrane protein
MTGRRSLTTRRTGRTDPRPRRPELPTGSVEAPSPTPAMARLAGRQLAALLPAGTLPYAVSKVIPGAAGFLGVLLFIRLAGPAAYGVYSIAFAAAVFTCSLSTGWLQQASLRFAGDRAAPWHFVSRRSVWAVFVAAGITTAVIVSVTLHDWRPAVAVGAGLLAASLAAQGLIVTLLQSELKPGKVVVAEAVRALLQIGVPVAALLMFARTGTTLLLAMACAVTVTVVVLPFGRQLLRAPSRVRAASDAGARQSTLRTWWSYGWPMSLWLSIAAVLQFSDRILIARWRGTGEAGAYAGMYDIINGGLAVCLFSITMAAHPRVSRLWNEGRPGDALRENRRALRAQVVLFAPLLVVAVLARGTLVRIVLNSAAPRSVAIVLPLLMGAFLWQLALTVHKRLELERRTRLMLLFVVVAAAFNVAGNALTIPRYGAPAAAWTTFLSAGMYLGLCALWRRMHPASRGPATGRHHAQGVDVVVS